MSISLVRPPVPRRRAGLAAAGLAIGALAVATVGAAPADASSGRSSTTYTVSKSGMVTGKAAQVPGRIIIKVAGHPGELFQLARSRKGAGSGKLVSDVAKLNGNGDPLPLEHDFALIGGAPVGQTMWATLHPGDYYAVDVNNPKLTKAGVKRIHVTNSPAVSANPAPYTRIQAIGEESWYGKPKTMPHSGTIAFENKAAQSHFIDLVRMKPGKTRADITKAFQGKEKQSAVFYSGKADEFDSGVLSPKHTLYLTYDLKPGTWMLACFWPDRKTHMPHAFMGMYRTIKLK